MNSDNMDNERPTQENGSGQENLERQRERESQSGERGNRDDERLSAIDQRYTRTAALGKFAELSRQEGVHDKASIDQIRADLGLKPLENPPSTAVEVAGEVLAEQTVAELQELDRKEREYLGAPRENEPVPADQQPGGEPEEPEIDAEENPEEPEAVEKRQKSMDEWVKTSTAHMKEHFASSISGTKNGPRAEKLLEIKVQQSIARHSEEYVKTGKGVKELGYVMSVKHVAVERPDGGTDHYVSEINTDSGPDLRERWPGLFNKDKEPLDAEEAKIIKQAKETGAATEEEVK